MFRGQLLALLLAVSMLHQAHCLNMKTMYVSQSGRVAYTYVTSSGDTHIGTCEPNWDTEDCELDESTSEGVGSSSIEFDLAATASGEPFVFTGNFVLFCTTATCSSTTPFNVGTSQATAISTAWAFDSPLLLYRRPTSKSMLHFAWCSQDGGSFCSSANWTPLVSDLNENALIFTDMAVHDDEHQPVIVYSTLDSPASAAAESKGVFVIYCHDYKCSSFNRTRVHDEDSASARVIISPIGTPVVVFEVVRSGGPIPMMLHCPDRGCTAVDATASPSAVFQVEDVQMPGFAFSSTTNRVIVAGFDVGGNAHRGSCLHEYCGPLLMEEFTIDLAVGVEASQPGPDAKLPPLVPMAIPDTLGQEKFVFVVAAESFVGAPRLSFVFESIECSKVCPEDASCAALLGAEGNQMCLCSDPAKEYLPSGSEHVCQILDKCTTFPDGVIYPCYWEGARCFSPDSAEWDGNQCGCQDSVEQVTLNSIGIHECVLLDACLDDANVAACGSHGTCVHNASTANLFTCVCDTGYTGQFCDSEIECPNNFLGINVPADCSLKFNSTCSIDCSDLDLYGGSTVVSCNERGIWEGSPIVCYDLIEDDLLATEHSLYQGTVFDIGAAAALQLEFAAEEVANLAFDGDTFTGVIAQPGNVTLAISATSPKFAGKVYFNATLDVAGQLLALGEEVVLSRGTEYTFSNARGPTRNFRGGHAPYEYKFKAGVVAPDGVFVAVETGQLLGTPTASGIYHNIVVDVVDKADATLSFRAFTIAVVDPLQITWPQRVGVDFVHTQSFVLDPPSSASQQGGKGTVVYSASGAVPTGISVTSTTGRIVGTPSVADELYSFDLIASDSSGSVVLERFSGIVSKPPDCDNAANGPKGKPCSNGVCVDDVKFDNEFACDCTGTNFTGDNCDVTGSVIINPGPNPVASSAASTDTSPIIGGVAGGCFLLIVVAVVLLLRRQDQTQPFDFEEELEKMRQEGLLRDEAEKKVPREMRRGQIKMLEKLGAGAFGDVFKGTVDEQAATGVPEYIAAIKTLKDDPSGQEKLELMREAALMAQFSHPNVVGLIGVCTKGMPMLLVVQFCEHGSLLSFLKKNPNLSVEALLKIGWDIAKGMEYLSGMGLVHRDLAARNVLIDSSQFCKIADFGLSRDLDTDDYYRAGNKGLVPVRWTSIEALEDQRFSMKSDVWAFGVTLHEVFTGGATPYEGMSNHMVWLKVKSGFRLPRADLCPKKLYNQLLLKCWDENPDARPTFGEVCEYFEAEYEFSESEKRALMTMTTDKKPRLSSFSSPSYVNTFNSGSNVTPAGSVPGTSLLAVAEAPGELMPEDIDGYVDFSKKPPASGATASAEAYTELGDRESETPGPTKPDQDADTTSEMSFGYLTVGEQMTTPNPYTEKTLNFSKPLPQSMSTLP
eukprot:m.43425 g.43425  ORF g.43425 m.43425 type:complete len:1401 (-) comp11636_c0_seq3:170-4372(-)